jgi:hypothetical protein
MNDDMLPPAHPLEIDDVEMDSESILDLREEAHRGATPGEMLVKKFVKDTGPVIEEEPSLPVPRR